MNHMPLLQHLKTLKAAMPQANQQVKIVSKLPIFKNIKQVAKKSGELNQGIFFNLSFCIPYIDPPNDPDPQKMTQLVRGIYMQGGLIVQFDKKMNEQNVKFTVVSQKTNIEWLKQQIKGLIKFEKIVRYDFILDSLKRLKLMDFSKYLLDNSEFILYSQSKRLLIAKQRLQAEKIDSNLIRPILPIKSQQSQNVQSLQKDQQNKRQIHRQQIGILRKEIIEIKQKYKDTIKNPLLVNQKESQNTTKEINSKSIENIKQQIVIQTIKPQPKTNILSPFHKQPFNKNRFKKIEQKPKLEQVKVQEKKLQEKKVQETKAQEKKTQEKKVQEKKVQEKKTQEKKIQIIEKQPYWQKKRQRRSNWFEPPKNLSSHNFKNNNFICDKFMQLQQIYKRNGDIRSFTYVKAVAIIKSHQKQIKTPQDLKQIKGLSNGLIEKARQLLQTGTMEKLTKYSRKQQNIVCKELQQVWGVGPKKAKQFYDIGIKTVQDLRKRPELISKNMSVGLKYFQQFKNRIPRQKITRIYELLKKNFVSMVHSDKTHFIEIVGSYRRQKQTCGDIDVLLSRKDGSIETHLIRNYVKWLQEIGFITQTLAQPRAYDGKNHSAFMGVCFYEQKHHRIDIKHYPIQQYPFALMYFTGSDLFNRQMRIKAHNKGLILSDHGLRPKEKNGIKYIWKGGQIPMFHSEQQIFKFLDFDYCKPSQRSI